MRSIFSFAVALCLVLAGASPSQSSIRERDRDLSTAQLVAAPHAVVTASFARRTGLDAGIRLLAFIAPAWAFEPSTPPRARFDLVEHAPRPLASTFVTTRSARGPPRSRS